MAKATGEQSAISTPSLAEGSLTFWVQSFSEEIDQTPIPRTLEKGDDHLSYKLFSGTLRGVVMHWLATQPPRSIQTFKDLANAFAYQFTTNKTKKLEVADLFNIKQNKSETLKSYLARFNNTTVKVNDPNKKFFVKAFQKGLRVGQFSDSLALRKPESMEEI
ncbi:hypothetical protein CR513_25421, partial [Mucuna pruriens]